MSDERLPMLAIPSTGASGRPPIDVRTLVATGDWVIDVKLDGVRAFRRNGRLINRNGVDITARYPEIQPGDMWLDGEIVPLDGSFETVLQRDKLTRRADIAIAAEGRPCRFIAFDAPEVYNRAWDVRRHVLSEALPPEDITPVSHDVAFIDQVRDLGLEGVIVKRRNSRYQFGRRSRDWVKHKNVHRVSCLLAGYSPGQGSRTHMGALHLALIDGKGGVAPVGRCGSGFTERETHELKARLDAGELLVAEIECLNVTSGNTLRFPVFKGLRADVEPIACTTTQLATIPRS